MTGLRPTRHAVAVAVLAGSLLAGCTSGLLESQVPAPDTYRLGQVARPVDPSAPTPTSTRSSSRALTVARPRASRALDTDRIAVVPEPRRFEYYSDVRWAEPAPQMLQQNLVAAFEASGRFAGTVAAPARVPSELMLDVEVRHFEAIAASPGATPEVFVQVQSSLVDVRRAQRLTSFVSEARVAAAGNRRDAIVAAFDEASARVVADVVERTATAAPAATAAGSAQ
jgi:cholesterol transport system auxiliary component